MAAILPLLRTCQIADMIGGKLSGNADLAITGARALLEAGEHDISFVADDRQQKNLAITKAGALITKPGMHHPDLAIIEVADPFSAFLKIYEHFHPALSAHESQVDPRAAVDPTAVIGEGCYIGPFAVVGAGTVIGDHCQLHAGAALGRNCKVGSHCVLYPHAVVYDGCTLGQRVILHANSVIGADGFGYRLDRGRHVKIPQMAGVDIADDVEVGAGTMIDRGTFEPTSVGEGTKIDNMVQIGHNCKIGKHNLLVSQVGIGGSSCTGDYVVMAGQVGVADHVHIGDQAVLGAQAGVPSDIPAKTRVLGAPARPERDAKVILLSLDKLPALRQDVRKIKQHLGMTG
ncbi:MAG: UDP-3-O-(3-hydroxymyristoyl)glucosamine N-acyltransferase [Gemmatales bacterium]